MPLLTTTPYFPRFSYVSVPHSRLRIAQWCPPCRGFTPRLSSWYTSVADKLKLKLVFASADRDEKQFKEYLGEMSFDLALPYKSSVIRDLNSLYDVEGIPTLVIIDRASGELLTKDGRKGVITDPEGAQFPWKPKSPKEILSSVSSFADKGGAKLDQEWFQGLDYIGIYFSAHVSTQGESRGIK